MTERIAVILSLTLAASAAMFASVASAQHFPESAYHDLDWRMIGPFRGGRTHAVTGVPSQPSVFYIGAVDGGVWKTDDAGRTWHPIFDEQPTQSIGAIAVAPSEPDVVYVGTGEGLFRPDLSVGDGIYRSRDAGRTWEHMGLPDAQQVAELAVDPRNANRVFAAVMGHPYGPSAERGIYRTSDGGHTWERVLSRDDNTGGCSVAIDPKHPDTVYAGLWEGRLGPAEDNNEFNGTGGGIFKSTDGGTTWHKLTKGLPDNLSQVNLEIASSSPNRVFAVISTPDPGDYSSAAGLGIFRSDDFGDSWVRITRDPRPALRIGGGDLASVRVDPSNPDVVYSASIVTMKSTDGGKTWRSLRGAPGGDDYQNLWISPRDPKTIALVADQGAVITLNGGQTWSSWFNQPTAQLYHIGVTPTFPYRVCSGQQESGSVCIASRGNDGEITDREWHPVGVIEYGYVAPDPLDADIVYGAGRTEVSKFHWSTGQVQNVTPLPVRGADVRADRTEPLMFSPFDPHTLYYAANRLYATSDGGATWQTLSPDLTRDDPGIPPSVGERHAPGADHPRGAIYAFAASPVAAGTLWAGTDDGYVWVTRDSGHTWSNVTPPGVTAWSKVTQIEASHSDANTAYFSVSRFRVDDLRPYVYRTRDGGKTWQSISDGLPADAPVNAVREDTLRPGLLFAATERSVWVSFDAGDHWDSLQRNLPHTSMRDLRVQENDLIVATHGRSFWILDDLSRLRQLTAAMLREVTLVKPAAAYRVQRSTWPDTPIPPDEPTAANPPAGAVIEYSLPRDAKGVVTLEVIDAQGATVRRYASDDPLAPSAEELAQQLIPPHWVLPGRRLPANGGMHRWIWDLHYTAPASISHGYPISAVPAATPRGPEGPVARPGTYTVRLTVDGKRIEAPLVVKEDPRVTVTDAALNEQFQLAVQLSAALTESSKTLLTVRSIRAQLKALATNPAVRDAVRAFDARAAALVEASDADKKSQSPKVLLPATQGRISALYQSLELGDAAPTAAQRAASDAAQSNLRDLLAAWRAVEADLPALNAQLRAGHVPEVRPDAPLERDLDTADEE